MPLTLAQIISAQKDTEDTLPITTNKVISEEPHPGFVYIGRVHTFAGDNSTQGRPYVDIDLEPKRKAVVFNSLQIDPNMHSYQAANHITYSTVADVTTGKCLPWSPTSNNKQDLEKDRLVRIMTPLILQQPNAELIPLTLRGEGATHAGHLGCASRLLGKKLTPKYISDVLNEVEISVDGKPITFQLGDVYNEAASNEILVHADHMDDANKIAVSFHGGHANSEHVCVVHDNPKERILTLIFPIVAKIPSGEVSVRDKGHWGDRQQVLVKGDIPLGTKFMPGLKEFLLGA